MHHLTLTELLRIVDATPGNEALSDLLAQIAKHHTTLRVDLNALLRKTDETKGSLPQR